MTPTIDITRLQTGQQGTFGALRFRKDLLCFTLERPWAMNKPNVSCIPSGKYRMGKVDSPRFGSTWEVMDVPDRTHILFHPANTVDELLGCIAPGRHIGTLRGTKAVLSSRKALDALMEALRGQQEAWLTITEAY